MNYVKPFSHDGFLTAKAIRANKLAIQDALKPASQQKKNANNANAIS